MFENMSYETKSTIIMCIVVTVSIVFMVLRYKNSEHQGTERMTNLERQRLEERHKMEERHRLEEKRRMEENRNRLHKIHPHVNLTHHKNVYHPLNKSHTVVHHPNVPLHNKNVLNPNVDISTLGNRLVNLNSQVNLNQNGINDLDAKFNVLSEEVEREGNLYTNLQNELNYVKQETDLLVSNIETNGMNIANVIISNNQNVQQSPNNSYMINDTNQNKELMLVGNSSGGGNRRIGTWDELYAHGKLTTDNFCIGNTCITEEDLITMKNANTLESNPMYQQCSTENGTCNLPYPRKIWFGSKGRYNTMVANGNVSCSNATFGGDPNPNVAKACYINKMDNYPEMDSANFTNCSSEGNTCNVGGTPKTVYFGANGKYNSKIVNGSVPCSVSTFGSDPNPGVPKGCYYAN